MSKYIDAERLLSEIQLRKKQDITIRERSILIDVETAIKSLQQEKPEVDLENNGWIDCGKQMPKETKQCSDILQGHKEWTESDLVLAWDSMYGCRVDATKNGKWMSEQMGGYTGQVVHSIMAWRPIPEFDEKLLFNERKEK